MGSRRLAKAARAGGSRGTEGKQPVLGGLLTDAQPRSLSAARLNDCSDGELLSASVGVAEAFDVFYRRHYLPVLKFVVSRGVRDTATALDFAAETFATAYLKRKTFKPNGRPARAWLFKIAANKITDARRRERFELAACAKLGIARRGYTDAALEEAEALIVATQLIDGLPPLERRAVMERVVLERSYAEIAADAAVTQGTIRARVSDGLAKLRHLQNELPIRYQRNGEAATTRSLRAGPSARQVRERLARGSHGGEALARRPS
jgi:RNA polymerase sigma factor (sigma-70 family)